MHTCSPYPPSVLSVACASARITQAACVLLTLCLPATQSAAGGRCEEAPVDVIAASSDERHVACSAAGDALALLGRCGISLRRPLRVEIVRQVRHPLSKSTIFGLFDTRLETVFIAEEASIPALVAGTPYSDLPGRDFYRSLIVHEVVHGVMHQNVRRPPTSHAAYEYPAYALQIASLPSSVRTRFLQSIPNNADQGAGVFNDIILLIDPFFFAARAYAHFSASDGCSHLAALLQGEVAFIPALPP